MNDPVEAEEPEQAGPLVCVVDDHRALRDGLCRLVRSVGLDCRGYATGLEFLEDYTEEKPGCIVLDLRMPDMGGAEVLQRLSARAFMPPVIMLTGFGDVPAAVGALRGGAVDFIEKPIHPDKMLEVIQSQVRKSVSAFDSYRKDRTIQDRFETLSEREREIMDLLVRGQSSKQIARGIGRSSKTVDVHRANILRKMEARSIADLIHFAVACGLSREIP